MADLTYSVHLHLRYEFVIAAPTMGASVGPITTLPAYATMAVPRCLGDQMSARTPPVLVTGAEPKKPAKKLARSEVSLCRGSEESDGNQPGDEDGLDVLCCCGGEGEAGGEEVGEEDSGFASVAIWCQLLFLTKPSICAQSPAHPLDILSDKKRKHASKGATNISLTGAKTSGPAVSSASSSLLFPFHLPSDIFTKPKPKQQKCNPQQSHFSSYIELRPDLLHRRRIHGARPRAPKRRQPIQQRRDALLAKRPVQRPIRIIRPVEVDDVRFGGLDV